MHCAGDANPLTLLHLVYGACHVLLQMEYRMAVRQVAHEDFLEGVRAALVDKDRHPAWLKAAAAAGQQGHQLRLSGPTEADAEPEQQQQSLPGNRFSVQHLFTPL